MDIDNKIGRSEDAINKKYLVFTETGNEYNDYIGEMSRVAACQMNEAILGKKEDVSRVNSIVTTLQMMIAMKVEHLKAVQGTKQKKLTTNVKQHLRKVSK